MDLYDAVYTRRSVRSFRPDAPTGDALNRVLDAARVAPSGSNRQPWRLLLVKNPETRRRVAEECGGQKWIAEAPMVVVALGQDIDYNRGGWMGDRSVLVDVSIAFTHLILAARAEGLGTCWIGMFDNEALKRLLGVPAGWNVVAVTPLGFPRGDPWKAPGKRKNLEEMVTVVE